MIMMMSQSVEEAGGLWARCRFSPPTYNHHERRRRGLFVVQRPVACLSVLGGVGGCMPWPPCLSQAGRRSWWCSAPGRQLWCTGQTITATAGPRPHPPPLACGHTSKSLCIISRVARPDSWSVVLGCVMCVCSPHTTGLLSVLVPDRRAAAHHHHGGLAEGRPGWPLWGMTTLLPTTACLPACLLMDHRWEEEVP